MPVLRSPKTVALTSASLVVLSASQIAAADVAIYGGPTYSTATGSGFTTPNLQSRPGSSVSNGMGAGNARKKNGGVDLGARVVRWDTQSGIAVELGNLGTNGIGYTSNFAWSVNANGVVVGYAERTGEDQFGNRAVRWDAGSTAAVELATLGTRSDGLQTSAAYAINLAGTTVGYAGRYSGATSLGNRAVRWDAGGTVVTELDHLGADPSGYASSVAAGVNAAGSAVGSASKYINGASAGTRAVRWDAGGTVATELGGLGTYTSGYAQNYAYAINDAGTAIGQAGIYVNENYRGDRAVRWDAGATVASELGHFGVDSAGYAFSYAYAINSAGTVVGSATKHTDAVYKGSRAARWDAGGTIGTELGTLGTSNTGYANSRAHAINSAGIAVGYVEEYVAGVLVDDRAVYWDLDGIAIDLNTLLSPADQANWSLTEAGDINDAGWITGIGSFDPDGAAGALPAYDRMFLIQIPTPSAAATLAFAGLVITKRRRR